MTERNVTSEVDMAQGPADTIGPLGVIDESTRKRIIAGEEHRLHEVAEARRPQGIMSQLDSIDLRIKDGEDPRGIEISRDLFAQTKNGERAFEMISRGEPCTKREVIGKDEEMCGKRSILVVDFDVMGDHYREPMCTPDHIDPFEEMLNRHLDEERSTLVIIGINGWGRA